MPTALRNGHDGRDVHDVIIPFVVIVVSSRTFLEFVGRGRTLAPLPGQLGVGTDWELGVGSWELGIITSQVF